MQSIETKITINSSPKEIWEVLTHFDSYKNWNPFIVYAKGKPIVNSQLTIDIKPSDKITRFKPVVVSSKTNQELRWKGQLFFPNLFDGYHYFILKQIDHNKTEVIHGEYFKGLIVKFVFNKIKDVTKEGFIAMNNALKLTVEQKKK